MPTKPPTFRPAAQPTAREQQRLYDRNRGNARQRGYTTRWDKQARNFKRTHPLCLGCAAVGWVSATTLVDHIVPHRQDLRLFWDPNNRQPSCDRHHSVVKQALEVLYLKGQATKADLKLDSALAITLTKQLLGS